MKRMKFRWARETFFLAGISFLLSLVYHGAAYAQAGGTGRYVTMSERIGRIIIQYRAFDVWIYFFQGLLLFLCIGLTAYYLSVFQKRAFVTRIRQKMVEMTKSVDLQSAIEFEMTSLSNKLLFLDLVIAGAPIAGLLGTVVGLVQVFSEQTVVEHVTMATIASGMYVAMVTTVVGLIVALIGIIARHFLDTRMAEIRDILSGAK